MLVPIFPLNIVLFPGMNLPLHIFEMRYREMVADCLATGKPFGLVLARDSSDEGICSTGTLAKITEVNRLEDGRMNIMTTGESRFRILSLDLSRSYHQAQISLWPDEAVEHPILAGVPLTVEAKSAFSAYLNLLLEMMNNEKPHQFNLPDDQVTLSYLIASRLQIDNEEKQFLLTLDSAVERLAKVIQFLKRETALLQRLKDQQMLGPDVNGFSVEYRSPLGGVINLN